MQAEYVGHAVTFVNEFAAPHCQQQTNDADHRRFHYFAHAAKSQIAAHEHCDRDCRADREHTPRTFGQCLDNYERQHRQQDDHDCQNCHDANGPGSGV